MEASKQLPVAEQTALLQPPTLMRHPLLPPPQVLKERLLPGRRVRRGESRRLLRRHGYLSGVLPRHRQRSRNNRDMLDERKTGNGGGTGRWKERREGTQFIGCMLGRRPHQIVQTTLNMPFNCDVSHIPTFIVPVKRILRFPNRDSL